MKTLYLMSAAALTVAGLAACTPTRPPPARAALDCPQEQGDLTRSAMAPDGRSCTYRMADGGEVQLQLVATNGNPDAALKAIEAELMAGIEAAKAEAGEAADTADAASGKARSAGDAAKAATDTAREAAADAAKASREAARDATSAARDAVREATSEARAAAKTDAAEDVNVHLPGLHVETRQGEGGKETARVNLPGIRIVADDETDSADIQIGGMHISARDGEAIIRTEKDVRLKGEAFSRQKRGMRATFIYAGKNLPDGARMVGYEAAGPKAGPLTVAVVRGRTVEEGVHVGDDDGLKDIRRLVRRNGGV